MIDETVRLLGTKSLALTEAALSTLKRFVQRILSRGKDEETKDFSKTISILRDFLYKSAHQQRSQLSDKRLSADLMDLLMAVHYHSMYNTSISLGLKELAAKSSISLLRYPEIIPADKAFYMAGTACREQGNINLAFLLLNR